MEGSLLGLANHVEAELDVEGGARRQIEVRDIAVEQNLVDGLPVDRALVDRELRQVQLSQRHGFGDSGSLGGAHLCRI